MRGWLGSKRLHALAKQSKGLGYFLYSQQKTVEVITSAAHEEAKS